MTTKKTATTKTSTTKAATTHLEVSPGPAARTFVTRDGRTITAPEGWACLAPGDAALTRRVKAAGPCFTVVEKRGNKTFSRGLWADAATIATHRAALVEERKDPAYAVRLAQGRARRERAQEQYEDDFEEAVVDFLAFHVRHAVLAATLARRVTAHAVPVGSGTVARTQRIPVEERAEVAVIAWLRHQTTAYDHMHIPREKGARREVRRMLAEQSRRLLEKYRRGDDVDGASCPLQSALVRHSPG
jgi:hypothetical protein